MTLQDEFYKEVNGFIASLAARLRVQDIADAKHLIDHGETGEALLSIAWAIKERQVELPAELIKTLRGLAEDLVGSGELDSALNHSRGTAGA